MGPGALAMRNLLNGELKAFGTSSSVPPLLMLCATSNFLEKAFGNLENSSVKRSALRRGKGFLEKYQPVMTLKNEDCRPMHDLLGQDLDACL